MNLTAIYSDKIFYADGAVPRHADWQGNVTMVTNGSGKVVQHTGYYPYGEPWREPSGQPYLYGGKERMREGGLNEYDFGARRYNSALAIWTTPDPVVHDQHSPYAYCAGNPIRYIDPNGMEFTEGSKKYVEAFVNLINNKWSLLNFEIYQLENGLKNKNLSASERKRMKDDIAKKHNERTELLQTKREITALKNSNQKYNIKVDSQLKEGVSKSYYNVKTDNFDIILCDDFSDGTFAHEMKHAYQFEIGSLSTGVTTDGFPFYDKTDEVEAYKRGAVYGETFDDKLPSRYDGLQEGSHSVEDYGSEVLSNPVYLQIKANQDKAVFRYNGQTYKSGIFGK